MMDARLLNFARLLALAAGAMDFATGLGLVLQPQLTLRLMLVPVPGAEALVYVRFVGVFVGAVGLSYLWALAAGRGAADGGVGRLREVLRFTLPFRLGAGTFCAVAVGLGALGPLWLSVTGADYALVVAQTWLLCRAPWREVAA